MATKKRRGRGEGALFQRNGRWYGVVSLGVVLVDGKEKRIRREVSGKTKQSVQQKLAGLRNETADSAAENLNVSEWAERWLTGLTSRVRPSTHKLYSIIVRTHITPAIGYVPLSKLTPATVAHFYATLAKKGVSDRTRQAVHSRMYALLKASTRLGLTTRNVAELVDAPRYNAPPVSPLSLDQVRTLLASARSERLFPLYLLAVQTGMRQGELFALRRSDVDLKAGTLSVNGTMSDDGTISPPKTARGRRRIDLSPDLIAVLSKYLKSNPGNGEFVFTSPDGTPLRKSNFIRRDWIPLLKKAKLPGVKFHSLRHTSATLLLSQGVHPKIVQERLGHSDISMTLDIYSHVVPGMGKAAADQLGKLIGGT